MKALYRKATDRELYLSTWDIALAIGELSQSVAAIHGDYVDECRLQLMNLEAQAAKRYWEAAGHLLITVPNWQVRVHRGADDPVNTCLNYGYGILYSQVASAISLAGLDPYAGFVHADRAGKPSMVFDLIEEFRQPVVDRTVFALFNRGETIRLDGGRLNDASRRLIGDRVLGQLDSQEPYRKRQHKLRTIIALQAQSVASYFKAETDYTDYVMRW